MQTNLGLKYGELVVVGSNGQPLTASDGKELKCVHELYRAEFATAVMPSRIDVRARNGAGDGDANNVAADFADLAVNSVGPRNVNSRDALIHMETKENDIVVTCTAVLDKDMFQMGRADNEKINCRVDMNPLPANSASNNTVSRYAARIIVNRRPAVTVQPDHDPHNPRIYGAAFDVDDRIFLGPNATTVELGQNEYDGFTTNGILILRPQSGLKLLKASVEELKAWQPVWQEVSVGGKVFETGDLRQPPTSRNSMTKDNNYLPDGTVIDLCGVQLLWRSHIGLAAPQISQAWLRQALSPYPPGSSEKPKRIVSCFGFDEVSMGLPNRLELSDVSNNLSESLREDELNAHPHAYMGCGHVVTRKIRDENTMLPTDKCPVKNCNRPGKLTPLQFSLEARFFIDPPPATHCFNPCGHVVPEKTAIIWSKIKPPRKDSTPICPFCAKALAEPPYVKLEFAYNDEDD